MARKITVHESEVEGTKKIPPRVSKTLLSEHTVGAKQISMGVNICEPGSEIPLHKHDESEEAMYLVEGKATLICDGVEYPLTPGTAFFSPLGVAHRVLNIGDVPTKIVWAYAPPLADHLKK